MRAFGTRCKYDLTCHLGGCCASARAAARGNALANAEELRGIGFTQESTSEIGGEDIVLSQRRSIIQIWQSWSQRMSQRYNAALQQWPTVSELVSVAVELLRSYGFEGVVHLYSHEHLHNWKCEAYSSVSGLFFHRFFRP